MDLRLPLLADANLHLGIALEAIEEDALLVAGAELEKADEALEQLRAIPASDGLFAAMLLPLEEKRAKVAELVAPSRLEEVEAEIDPEQEEPPSE